MIKWFESLDEGTRFIIGFPVGFALFILLGGMAVQILFVTAGFFGLE